MNLEANSHMVGYRLKKSAPLGVKEDAKSVTHINSDSPHIHFFHAVMSWEFRPFKFGKMEMADIIPPHT